MVESHDRLRGNHYSLLEVFVFMATIKPNTLHHVNHLVSVASVTCFDVLIMAEIELRNTWSGRILKSSVVLSYMYKITTREI